MNRVLKWVFILFNIAMLLLLLFALRGAEDLADQAASRIGKARVALGAQRGFIRILLLWVVVDAILGALLLFTRSK